MDKTVTDQIAAAWPEITVSGFADRLAEMADADHVTDLYLAFACARGDASAIAALDRKYLAPLTAPLRKMGLDASAIDETLQIVRDELLVARTGKQPGILNYGGRGALAGWLRSVAVRTALRDRKKPERRGEYVEGGHAAADDLELAYMKKTYGAAFERAFATALGQLEVEDRLLLKQRFGHRLGVVELGKMYGVNAGTITRRVQAVRDRLLESTRDSMKDEVGTDALTSILKLIESQLDLSLSGL